MSFQSQWLLTYDDAFVSRCRACITQQADIYQNDARADFVATAKSILRGDKPAIMVTYQNMLGAAPGLADKADNGDGTIDSTKITDAEVLSNVQNEYPNVASLYFDSTGAPIP